MILGRFGYIGRGVVFGVIGFLMIQAAIQSNPARAGGVEDAFNRLADYQILLGCVAAGVAAYGLFHLIAARHWRIRM